MGKKYMRVYCIKNKTITNNIIEWTNLDKSDIYKMLDDFGCYVREQFDELSQDRKDKITRALDNLINHKYQFIKRPITVHYSFAVEIGKVRGDAFIRDKLFKLPFGLFVDYLADEPDYINAWYNISKLSLLNLDLLKDDENKYPWDEYNPNKKSNNKSLLMPCDHVTFVKENSEYSYVVGRLYPLSFFKITHTVLPHKDIAEILNDFNTHLTELDYFVGPLRMDDILAINYSDYVKYNGDFDKYYDEEVAKKNNFSLSNDRGTLQWCRLIIIDLTK